MKPNLMKVCAINVMAALLLSGCHSPNVKSKAAPVSAPSGTVVARKVVDTRPISPVTTTIAPAQTIAAPTVVQTGDQGFIELRKEEMVVGKKTVSNGGVVLRTTVQAENVSAPVELRHEEYVIERIPASEAATWATNTAIVFQGQEIYIPLTREEPVAGKRTLAVEKVQIGKKVETDAITVSHPVRSESVEVVKTAAPPEKAPICLAATPIPASTVEMNKDNVELTREEMIVGKRQIDNGAVRLRKVVTTQDASQPVDLTREEYTVSRTPLADQAPQDASFTPRQVKLDLVREEPVVGTQNHLTEVVRVRKQTLTNTQVVTGTVLKEGFELVKVPAAASLPAQGAQIRPAAAVVTNPSTNPVRPDTTANR